MVIGLAFLVSCGGGSQENREETTVITHMALSPKELHPINTRSAAQMEIFSYIHTALVKEDNINEVIAPDALVATPEYNKETQSYECELRDYLTFDDGSPITAEDVVFSFKLQVCPEMQNAGRGGNLEVVERIDVIDPTHFNVYCPEPNIEDVSLWTVNPILQKRKFDSAGVFDQISFKELQESSELPKEISEWVSNFNGAAFGSELKWMVGAGPYQLTTWTENEIVLRKKDGHWTENSSNWYHQNHPDKIVFKVTRDPNARYLDIKNELVDVSSGFGSVDMAKMMEDSFIKANYNQYFVPQYSFILVSLNLRPDVVDRKPIFTDKKVRQAFAHALPVQQAIDQLSNGTATHIASPISVNKPEYKDDLVPYSFDIEKAKQLLAEAGWNDSDGDGVLDKIIDGEKVDLKIQLTMRNMNLFVSIGKIFIEGLNQAGFDASIHTPEDWISRLTETHDFDCLFHGISLSFGPVYPFSLYESDNYPTGNNFSGYNNPAVDSLSELVSNTFDFDARKKLLFEFQDIVYEELPYALVTTGKRGVLVHKKFGEVTPCGNIPPLLLNTLKQEAIAP